MAVLDQISEEELLEIYRTLNKAFGHQRWWPAEEWFETIVGAILAQNVSWTGAQKAVSALINSDLASPQSLITAGPDSIADLIHSSRYYNQKAKKLIIFSEWFIKHYKGDKTLMSADKTEKIRNSLLELKGFGPETVDSILLYACNKPVFVIDAYTRRIGSRRGWFSDAASYQQIQDFFTQRLHPDVDLYNDYHAQLVRLGSQICKTAPNCDACPIRICSERWKCHYMINKEHTPRTKTGTVYHDSS
jgi:endonuclease-3 related protein